MKLTKKISPKVFVTSNLLILTIGLTFLSGLYYILNIQYQPRTNPFLLGPVTSAPKLLRLDLDQPEDDNLTFQSSLIVAGQTAPYKDVLIFSDSENLVVSSKSNGSFSTVLNLKEGVNTINVAVFDTTGESKSEQRTVYYAKEKL